MSGFFNNWKTIYYKDRIATNILSRISLNDKLVKDLSNFYPYEVEEGDRPDNVAYREYGSAYYDWVVMYSNLIVDPYFEWPLSQTQFVDFINFKYGSTREASMRVNFFRVNWSEDESFIDVAAYRALSSNQKKYWKPVLGDNNTIVSYERKPLDLVCESNKTIFLKCTTSGQFQIGEQLVQYNLSGQVQAVGYISKQNEDGLVVNKVVQGDFSPSFLYRGSTSFVTANVTQVTLLSQSITPEEGAYWSPVSFMTYEEELNRQRKTIYLLQPGYIGELEKQVSGIVNS